jgi:hypothetical protein
VPGRDHTGVTARLSEITKRSQTRFRDGGCDMPVRFVTTSIYFHRLFLPACLPVCLPICLSVCLPACEDRAERGRGHLLACRPNHLMNQIAEYGKKGNGYSGPCCRRNGRSAPSKRPAGGYGVLWEHTDAAIAQKGGERSPPIAGNDWASSPHVMPDWQESHQHPVHRLC